MRPLPHDVRSRVRGTRGFTLLEMLVTLTVLSLVVITLSTVLIGAVRSKTSTTNTIESTQAARAAIDMIERDLRSAGYGTDVGSASPQPAIAYIDSMELILAANLAPYPDGDAPAPPLAYDPAGNPNSGGKWGGNPDVYAVDPKTKKPLYMSGKALAADPNERGWKDTVIAYPGQVTRIAVRWAPTDLPVQTTSGLASLYYPFDPNGGGSGHGYVWHCHIIDHEDNEMMRPDLVMLNPAGPAPADRLFTKGTDY